MDLVIDDLQWDSLQAITGTGAGYAFAGFDEEQCIMGRTLDQFLVDIEKLVFLPFETGTRMRALVVISEELGILVNHKNGPGFTFDLEFETLAAGVFDIGGFAEV
jgi:hypothetical protein